MTVRGNKFMIPVGVAANAALSVYDLQGKLLYRKLVHERQELDLGKAIGASRATYIVKIGAKRTAR